MKAETRTFYLCGVDWQHEIGETSVRLQKTEDTLPECSSHCGVVKLTVTAKWVRPQKLAYKSNKRPPSRGGKRK